MTDLEKSLDMADLVWRSPDITKGHTQAKALEIDGSKWVVFEASDSLTDILDHIQFWPTKFNGYYVHTGWLNQYKKIRAWVKHQCDTDLPIVFCGHSLGGSLAQIASLDLGGRVVSTGSPKPFFGKVPKMDCIRFRTKDDPIPTLPPGYKSAGFEVVLPGGQGWKDHLPGAYRKCI